jgi:hypothetical protein
MVLSKQVRHKYVPPALVPNPEEESKEPEYYTGEVRILFQDTDGNPTGNEVQLETDVTKRDLNELLDSFIQQELKKGEEHES